MWRSTTLTGCHQTPQAPFTRYNLLSNWLSNRSDNRLYHVYKHSTGCQTRLTTGWMFVYTIQPVVKPVVQPGLTTGWMNSGCSFNTVVKPVWQLVWYLATGLITGCIMYTNIQLAVKPVWQLVGWLLTQYSRLSNQFHNRLYCVNGVSSTACFQLSTLMNVSQNRHKLSTSPPRSSSTNMQHHKLLQCRC